MDKPLYYLVLGNLPGIRNPNDPDTNWTQNEVEQRGRATRNCSVQVLDKPHHVSVTVKASENEITPLSVPTIKWCDLNKEQFLEEEQRDKTLKSVFAKIGRQFKSPKGHFYSFVERGGLLHRQYCLATGRKFNQIVMPNSLRGRILQVAHGSLMAGHQGIRRTTDHTLADFYWPDMHGDAKRFIKSCDKCQRATPKAKLVLCL